MDWIFKNLEKLIPILIALIYILSAFRGSRGGGEEEESDADAQRRAREMQEEIRRKILERQRQGQSARGREASAQQPSSPQPDYDETPFREEHTGRPLRPAHGAPERSGRMEEPESEPEPASASPLSRYEEQIAEQRRQIDSKMREASELKRKAQEQSVQVEDLDADSPYAAEARLNRLRRQIRENLADPESFRRALLLKEILDRPVGRRDEISGHIF